MTLHNFNVEKWSNDFKKPFRSELQSFYKKWCKKDSILFHGSNLQNLLKILPYQANCEMNAEGNLTAVYATNDIHLAIYYAILDKKKWRGYSISEKSVQNSKIYYFFALEENYLDIKPFTSGRIYVVNKKNFNHILSDKVSIFEWYSAKPESIIDSIEVSYDDFKFLNHISVIEKSHLLTLSNNGLYEK